MASAVAVAMAGIVGAEDKNVPSRTMAVTFDDLPYVDIGGRSLSRAVRTTDELLRVLKMHQVPTVAFVNEIKLQVTGEEEARTDLLRRWVNAGMILGNHTYSHPDFNAMTVEQFEDEIVKGDAVTRRLMKSHGAYQLYFRHPMTHTGDTKEKKEAIEQFLSKRGYKIAPHTIENSDFIFNVGYVRALNDKDQETAARLRNQYVDFTIAATDFAERVSPEIFGREIPQTLLIHANDINADSLDELLKRFEARGYKFVTLDQVMSDPAYQTKDDYVGKYGPTWLFRWMKSKGLNVSFKDDPEPPQNVMELYRQR